MAKKNKLGNIQRKNNKNRPVNISTKGKAEKPGKKKNKKDKSLIEIPCLKITLKSDLCVGAGESYQSKVDQEVVYDDYGFPYIPAKRLRGCIRESALELVEFGRYTKESYDALFGKEGNQASKFILNDAHLKDYEQMVKDLQVCSDQSLRHPQNVLELYTYTRTQTKIDCATGIAQDNSLRTMRVVKKDLSFFADMELKAVSKEEKNLLEEAISMTKHIGLNRTRGLGLVEMSLEQKEVKLEVKSTGPINEGKNKISYDLYLSSNVLCKSVEGNQTRTQDYIEGGKILGLLAERLKDAYKDLMSSGDIIASNAYIAYKNKRCLPVKASYQKEKDQEFKKGQMEIKDMLYLDPKVDTKDFDKQLTPVSYGWMNEDYEIQDVETEIRYHHSRPEDKSIGHAKGDGEGEFYQLNSLKAGQVFKGYILTDNKEQASTIRNALRKRNTLRMGSGKLSEYGDVRIENIVIEPVEKEEEWVNEFELKLNAPLILYNENLMPTADVKDLTKYLSSRDLLGTNLTLEKSFLKYETIGGFNVTWNRRKQSMIVLGKGTVCTFKSDQKVNISLLKDDFIGQRTSEGYGEVSVSTLKDKHPLLYKSSDAIIEEAESKTNIIEVLKYQKKRRELLKEAREKGQARKVQTASLAKFRIIFNEQNTLDAIKEQIDEICKEDKNKECKSMYNEVSEICQEDLEHYEIYVREYIKSLKYQLKEDQSNE